MRIFAPGLQGMDEDEDGDSIELLAAELDVYEMFALAHCKDRQRSIPLCKELQEWVRVRLTRTYCGGGGWTRPLLWVMTTLIMNVWMQTARRVSLEHPKHQAPIQEEHLA